MRILLTLSLLLTAAFSPMNAEVRVSALPDESVLDEAPLADASPRGSRDLADKPHSSLDLPYYEVEVGNNSGKTTIFALRNGSGTSTTGTISYFDKAGNLRTSEAFSLANGAVHPVNVRMRPNLVVDGDGIARGYVKVVTDNAAKLSGDYFLVDPGDDFASGGRLISSSDRCVFWDLRFLQGGAFSGGTTLMLYVDNPQGTGPSDPPSMALIVYDESGSIFGSVGIHMNEKVAELPVGNVLAALPGGIGPSAGSLWAGIGAPGGGYIQAVYDADGRYSVNLGASCLD